MKPRRVELDGAAVPDANEEYLLYQTLAGTWPLDRSDGDAWAGYIERISRYMEKAHKEALKAILDAKGRISRSELKQHAAGQFNATLHCELVPTAAGPFRDRLSQQRRQPVHPGHEQPGGTKPAGHGCAAQPVSPGVSQPDR